jgi:hypothetical protein
MNTKMNLPSDKYLSINKIAACFNNTSATYKYYWFLSIIQEVENGSLTISKRQLFARMISNAWFTVNYFHISFGRQDLIQDAIHLVNQIEKIPIGERNDLVFQKLATSKNKETERQLWHFDRNVPHWFLSPWFPGKSRLDIYNESKKFSESCLYALHNDRIEINSVWKNYLFSNARVLKDFCYWNLSLFLQAKNPNVPDIPNKLIKPARRNNLKDQRKKFWDLVLIELGSVNCIYTGKKLAVGNYAVDHFIPYSFVSHDLIWNLIPAEFFFNSSKGDNLPPLDKKRQLKLLLRNHQRISFLKTITQYFPTLIILQRRGSKIVFSP